MPKGLIRKNSLAEQLTEILRQNLENGDYQDGDKLPSETELMRQYDVSRLTVRAAIARLNAIGYIETRAGEGSYFKAFDRNRFMQEVSTKMLEPRMLDDINDFRRLIDVECIRLAIQNAGDADMDRLKEACDNFNNFLSSNTDLDADNTAHLVELDYKFHLTVCELSGNSLYPLAYMTAQEALKQYICANFQSRWRFNDSEHNAKAIDGFTRGHVDLYNAICERNFPKAKRFILAHIDYNIVALPKKN
ncbi:FadR/GntR family transcriptional regulator [Anaerotruncus sp. AF02-27]|uniref:FadR/GntR family transcriptional regulator n=1 Tax=Anaerotruncus sp. AF02-27 TaxID=2292191 RepID=UPI0011C2272C|nr:GntR family transcriptional regulator [Anaerotruncus sp. AF02-27]